MGHRLLLPNLNRWMSDLGADTRDAKFPEFSKSDIIHVNYGEFMEIHNNIWELMGGKLN